MKSSVATLCPTFNMQRVVKEYAADCYVVAHERYLKLTAADSACAKALAAWSARLTKNWPQVRVEAVEGLAEAQVAVGSQLRVRARVRLGAIAPREVAVELYLGRLNAHSEISDGVAIPMKATGESANGVHVFEVAAVPCRESGLHGYTVRVVPFHADEAKSFLPGMIAWADGPA